MPEFTPTPGPEGAAQDAKYARFQAQPVPTPEMIQFVQNLLGSVPAVKKLRRYLGFFQHDRGGGRFARMAINAITAKDPKLLAKVLAHEIGHMVDWLPDRTMARGNVLGRVASLHKYMKTWIAGYPGGEGPLTEKERDRLRGEAKKLLSKGAQIEIEEEIVQTFDITPEDVLAIWNSIDQTKLNPDLLRYIKRLTTPEILSIVKEALKGQVPAELQQFAKTVKRKTGKMITKTVMSDPTAQEVAEKYRELLQAEIEKRLLLSAETMREELIELTEWWSPFNRRTSSASYIKYRESSPELYAEALSVFLNSPGDLANRAPEFFRGFVAYIDEKPEVFREYMAIQDLLNRDPELLSEARMKVFHSWYLEAGQKILAYHQILDELRRLPTRRVIELLRRSGRILKQSFLARGAPIYRLAKRTLSEDPENEKAKAAFYAINELSYSENRNTQMLKKMKNDVLDPLIGKGITLDDIGDYLILRRIINGRGELANPGGFDPIVSRVEIEHLKRRIGEDGFKFLEERMQVWHDIIFECVKAAVDAGVYSRERFEAEIVPNKDNYAAFMVIKYLEGTISPMLNRQVGTFEAIGNPWDATIMKMVALNRLTELNRAKIQLRDFMLESWPDEIKPTPIPTVRGVRMREPGKPAPPGMQYLYIYEDGRQMAYAVPWEIASSFKSHDIGQLAQFARMLSMPIYKIFHPLFVQFNPAFLVGNPFRDIRRTYPNLGALSAKWSKAAYNEMIKQGKTPAQAKALARPGRISYKQIVASYFKALPPASRHASGIEEKVVDEMLDAMALGTSFIDVSAEAGETNESIRLMKQHGLHEGKREVTAARQVWNWTLGLLPWIGNVEEAASKIGAWELITQKQEYFKGLKLDIISDREKAFIVRTYAGTPNFREGGLATPLSNATWMYSNVRGQGLSADLGLATNRTTAAGWWWRQFIGNILPTTLTRIARYGGFGLAVQALLRAIGGDDKDEEDPRETSRSILARAGKYFLDNYDCIPLGILSDVTGDSETAKAVFISIPKDDIGQTISTLWGTVLDMAVASISPDRDLSPGKAVTEATRALTGQFVPELSPPLDLASKWIQYWSGYNPVDSYRRSGIVPSLEWKAGGWSATRKMLAWTETKLGSVGQVTHMATGPYLGAPYETGRETTIETIIRMPLGWNRLLRVSGAGIQESEWDEIQTEERESDRFRLGLPGSSMYLAKEFWRYSRLDNEKLSEKRQIEGLALRDWYYHTYIPTTQQIKASSGTPDEISFRTLLAESSQRTIDTVSEIRGVKDPWNHPDQLSSEVQRLMADHAEAEIEVAALERGRPEQKSRGVMPIQKASESTADYRARWQQWKDREVESDEDYQARLEAWGQSQDVALRFLKEHRTSPIVQKVIKKIRSSSSGRAVMVPKPPEAPQGGAMLDDWSRWAKRVQDQNRKAAWARKILNEK